MQGQLSDCWFLSALSVTAMHKPHAMEELNFTYDPKTGACTVRFWKNFQQET